MFENLTAPKPDAILALMQMYRDDPRDQKVDLGVGVYKNAAGVTPVMRAIKAAEERLWQEQQSKSYVGLA
ncbi:MAG: aromatic amino acid aminotransferase, partial [Pseudomonadota bacterium]